MTQTFLSEKLGVDQSALSRIENYKQMLSATQLVALCELTGISGESFHSGHFEFTKSASLEHGNRVGDFRLPQKYARDRGTKVRATLPLLRYFEEKFGQAKLENYLQEQGVDPDFLVNLDNQVNIDFSLDICRHLIRKGSLKPRDIPRLVKPVSRAETHGRLHYFYDAADTSGELLKTLIGKAKHYECNFNYAISDATQKSVDLCISPLEHMERFRYRRDDVLGDFLCRYKQHYFARFMSYGSESPAGKLRELECHFKGSPRCVYRIEAAA